MTAKTPGERFVEIEGHIKSILKDISLLQKSIDKIGDQLEEKRRSSTNRIWSIAQPFLTLIIGAILALAFSGHIIVK